MILSVRVFSALVCLLLCKFASGETETNSQAVVHFRLAENFLIIVPVQIGDAGPFDFLVDTGTNTTLIDPALADELKLKPIDRVQMMTPAGSMAIPRTQLGMLRLGPILLQQVEALVQPLETACRADRHIRGILGSNFFDHFDYLLDYKHNQLVFDLDHSQTRLMLENRLDLVSNTCTAQNGNRNSVEVNVEISPFESRQVRMQIDSGIRSPALYDAPGKRAASKTSHATMQVASNLGQTTAEVIEIRHLKVGEHVYSDVPFAVIPNQQLASTTCTEGLLPSWLFHSLFISHSGKFVVVEPRSTSTPATVAAGSAP